MARRYDNFGSTTIPYELFTRPLNSYYNKNILFRICALDANKPKNAPNAEPPCAALLPSKTLLQIQINDRVIS
jgi:hypothetical protein